jgi:transketolase
VTDRPHFIKVRTTIGFGSKFAESYKVHGSPLGEEEVVSVKTKFGFDPAKKFFIPEEVFMVTRYD